MTLTPELQRSVVANLPTAVQSGELPPAVYWRISPRSVGPHEHIGRPKRGREVERATPSGPRVGGDYPVSTPITQSTERAVRVSKNSGERLPGRRQNGVYALAARGVEAARRPEQPGRSPPPEPPVSQSRSASASWRTCRYFGSTCRGATLTGSSPWCSLSPRGWGWRSLGGSRATRSATAPSPDHRGARAGLRPGAARPPGPLAGEDPARSEPGPDGLSAIAAARTS